MPLLIIICLGAVTWVGTHLLDPYRPLARTAPGQPVGTDVKPLEVQVVALHWKWLFIYPEQGIATVNELAVPEGRPLRFRISSSSVMNSFYVPAMAGQIYAMPGMETKLNAVFNETGNYEGFSANYSGAGFSNMRFGVRSMTPAGFERWAAQARTARHDAGPRRLSEARTPQRKGAGAPLRQRRNRAVRPRRQHVRRARQDVHARHDGDRRSAAAWAGPGSTMFASFPTTSLPRAAPARLPATAISPKIAPIPSCSAPASCGSRTGPSTCASA